MIYYPRDCPQRSAFCHGTCQRYLKAYVLHTLSGNAPRTGLRTSGRSVQKKPRRGNLDEI